MFVLVFFLVLSFVSLLLADNEGRIVSFRMAYVQFSYTAINSFGICFKFINFEVTIYLLIVIVVTEIGMHKSFVVLKMQWWASLFRESGVTGCVRTLLSVISDQNCFISHQLQCNIDYIHYGICWPKLMTDRQNAVNIHIHTLNKRYMTRLPAILSWFSTCTWFWKLILVDPNDYHQSQKAKTKQYMLKW